MAIGNPYGAARIKSGMVHFLFGKALSSVASIAYFVLLVRLLPIEEFAAYTIMTGMVEVVNAISGLGLMHILVRYIPELYGTHNLGALRTLMTRLFAARISVLALFLFAIAASSSWLTPQLGLAQWKPMFMLYLWVILFRVTSAVLFVTLESMLQQGPAQLANSMSAFIRVLGLLWLSRLGIPDLRTILLIEIAAEALSGLVMLYFFVRRVPAIASTDKQAVGRGWMAANTRRMLDFGLKAYVQHLLVLPSDGAVDRLLIGGRLPSAEVALFGFGQWVYDLMQRFLPAQLLHGVYRPVMNSRFSNSRDFSEIVAISNLILKINIVLIGAVIIIFAAGENGFVTALTGGKFDRGALLLAGIMCVNMMVMSWRHVLDQASHTVECNEALIWSNCVLASSVIPGFLLIPYLGVYALPAAHIFGGIAGNFALLQQLKRRGFVFKHQSETILYVLVVIALSCLISAFLNTMSFPWLVNIVVALTVYGLMLVCVYPTDEAEYSFVSGMLKNRAIGPGVSQL